MYYSFRKGDKKDYIACLNSNKQILKSLGWGQNCCKLVAQNQLYNIIKNIIVCVTQSWYGIYQLLQKLGQQTSILSISHTHSSNYSVLRTCHFKSGQKTLKNIFAGIRQGQGTKLWHHDAVPLAVLLVRVTPQKAAPVNHLAALNLKAVQQRHSVKPVVITGKILMRTYVCLM